MLCPTLPHSHSLPLGELSSSDEDALYCEDKENEVPPKSQPHLCFEISSEDGLSVQADSIDGMGPLPSRGCWL